jgi:hypothetical protein
MPAASEIVKLSSWPIMPCSRPPLDRISVPSAINALPPASPPDPGAR